MFLKSEEDERRPDKKKYHFDPIKVLIGMAVGFITPEIARFLSEKVISNNTLDNIAGVSSLGLALVFGIIMLFVTFRVEFIYKDENKEDKIQGTQDEVTDMLSEYHKAKENGEADRMADLKRELKARGVIIKK